MLGAGRRCRTVCQPHCTSDSFSFSLRALEVICAVLYASYSDRCLPNIAVASRSVFVFSSLAAGADARLTPSDHPPRLPGPPRPRRHPGATSGPPPTTTTAWRLWCLCSRTCRGPWRPAHVTRRQSTWRRRRLAVARRRRVSQRHSTARSSAHLPPARSALTPS